MKPGLSWNRYRENSNYYRITVLSSQDFPASFLPCLALQCSVGSEPREQAKVAIGDT